MNQVGVLFMDNTNLWSGLEEDDDAISILAKGQKYVNKWTRSIRASGGDFNVVK